MGGRVGGVVFGGGAPPSGCGGHGGPHRRPVGDTAPILAAVGQLQFEVFAHRLEAEFGAPTELTSSPYQAIRVTDEESAPRLRAVGGIRVLVGDVVINGSIADRLEDASRRMAG